MASVTVPRGHVGLVLLEGDDHGAFYLEIPLHIINNLCVAPLRYLLFLGWRILGVEGTLARGRGGAAIGIRQGVLDPRGIYHYIVPAGDLGKFFCDIVVSCMYAGHLSAQQRSCPCY